MLEASLSMLTEHHSFQYNGLFSFWSSPTVSLEIILTRGLINSSTSKNFPRAFGEELLLLRELRLQLSSRKMNGLSERVFSFSEVSNDCREANRDVLILEPSSLLVSTLRSSTETSVKQEFYFWSWGRLSSKSFMSVQMVDCVGKLSINCCYLSSLTGVIKVYSFFKDGT